MEKSNKIKLTLLTVMLVTPVIISVPLHFLHDLINCPFIAVFSPINESVAEHAKIIIYPVAIASVILYAVLRKPLRIPPNKFFTATLVNALASEYFMVVFFYFIFYGLGIPSSLFAHIVLEVVSMSFGLISGYHICKKGNPKIGLPITITIFSITVILMTVFTFLPPNAPIFIS